MSAEPDADILITPTQSADLEHESPVDRARNALRRVHMDPSMYPTLVREIAKEICEAEFTVTKKTIAVLRLGLDGPLGPNAKRQRS